MIRRCSHPDCKTTLHDDDPVCPHGLGFCDCCTWEDGCPDCDTPAAKKEESLTVSTDPPTPARFHTLTITETEHHTADAPDWAFAITCSTPDRCVGWTECPDMHEGYDPEDEDSPAYDEYEDVMIHGVAHEWHYGYGWTVPFEGCVVAANYCIGDEVRDIACEHGAGVYKVDNEWDDMACYLSVIGDSR